MKRKIKYTDEPLGNVRVVEDFLPAPQDLVFKGENVKVTMSLSKASVEFFKQEAKKYHTSYQGMIRRLLDLYTKRHKRPMVRASAARSPRRSTPRTMRGFLKGIDTTVERDG
jgi:predicted DNA binding CopG/RHH family protein